MTSKELFFIGYAQVSNPTFIMAWERENVPPFGSSFIGPTPPLIFELGWKWSSQGRAQKLGIGPGNEVAPHLDTIFWPGRWVGGWGVGLISQINDRSNTTLSLKAIREESLGKYNWLLPWNCRKNAHAPPLLRNFCQSQKMYMPLLSTGKKLYNPFIRF